MAEKVGLLFVSSPLSPLLFSFLFSQNLVRNSLVIGDERLYLKKMAIMGERGYSTLRILKHKILESLEVRKKK